MKKLATLPIILYRTIPQVFFKGILFPLEGSCRYSPTCSTYAVDAINSHGVLRGIYMTIKRVARCNPFGGFGYDPVPQRARQSKKKKL